MDNERYNHKYTHCTATKCESRADCVHYLSYLEAVKLGLKDIKTCEHCEDKDIGYVRVRIEKV